MQSKGGIKSTSINGVKQYSISGIRNTTALLDPKKRRSLRKDIDYQRRLDVIQDLRFETAAGRIKVTPDGEYVIASGIYPPQVKVYELRQLALKFERHFVSEIVNFEVLDDDFSKLAFLCTDRSIRLHAKYGSHYSLRIPRMGRDIAYDCWSCDLFCAASSPDLYRINLQQGGFMKSLTTQSPGLNVVSRSVVHGLVASGGDDGAVECFDPRKKASIGRIDTFVGTGDTDKEVTAVEFDEQHGHYMAAGTSAGKILIYDLRMSSPVTVKDHMYGSPILNIKWHQTLNSQDAKIISTDSHIVRVWDPNTGDNMTSVESTNGAINDICIFRNSGLMLLALDSGQIPAYFVPDLGPAPKWYSHLDGLTEEMEEGTENVFYEDYKFLTKEELEKLNLTKYIGTNYLRASMHGFLIKYDLYKQEQARLQPFDILAHRERVKQEKLVAERSSRITMKRKLPKVNRLLAKCILENEETETGLQNDDDASVKKKTKKNKGAITSETFKDERFKVMFENKDFEIDEMSTEYQSLHPQSYKKQNLVSEHFDLATGSDEEESYDDSDASAASALSEDEPNKATKKAKQPRLFEVKDARHAEAFLNNISLAEEDAIPIGERVAKQEQKQSKKGGPDVKYGPGGSREMSFVPRSWRKHSGSSRPDETQGDNNENKRRGVHSLGLKPDKSEFYSSRGRGSGRGRGRGGGSGRGRGGGRGRGKGRW